MVVGRLDHRRLNDGRLGGVRDQVDDVGRRVLEHRQAGRLSRENIRGEFGVVVVVRLVVVLVLLLLLLMLLLLAGVTGRNIGAFYVRSRSCGSV